MSFADRRQSLTSENADETIRRNTFEDRLLRRKLHDIEKHAARQKKKRTTEQLDYALGNLSLEDHGKFTYLTKKILRSNFLPPIDREVASSAGQRDEEERKRNGVSAVEERLRGSTITKGSRSRKMLTRSMSADSPVRLPVCMASNSQQNTVKVSDQGKSSGKFTILKERVTKSSSAPDVEWSDLDKEEKTTDKLKARVWFAGLGSDETTAPSYQKRAQDKTSPKYYETDKHQVEHECIGDAIAYKLKMRETARKTKNKGSAETMKEREDAFLSAYSKGVLGDAAVEDFDRT